MIQFWMSIRPLGGGVGLQGCALLVLSPGGQSSIDVLSLGLASWACSCEHLQNMCPSCGPLVLCQIRQNT